MKIICKILAFGTIALSVGGCDLTMLPEHELSPEQYFQNESDLTLWSNQFYNDNLESADIGINDADDKIDNGLSDYITGSRNAASQTWSFSALRKINYLLEHLDQCPDRALATKYEAVARFSAPTSTSSKCAPTAMCPITTTCSARPMPTSTRRATTAAT